MNNEAQFGTIYGQVPGAVTQQLSTVPPMAINTFLARGTYQLDLAGQPAILNGEVLPPEENNTPLYAAVWATTRMVAEVQRRQQGWNVAFVSMRATIGALAHEVAELKNEIQKLQKAKTYVVPLITLNPSPFQMMQQIPVTVEGDGEDFTATFVEGNVSASGETEADAIANFKESLVSSYEVLEEFSPNQLGPLPARQWDVLQCVIKRSAR